MARFKTKHEFDKRYPGRENPAEGDRLVLRFKDGHWQYLGHPVDVYTYYRCEDCGQWTPPSACHYCPFSEEE